MFCPNCGKKVRDDEKVCPKCGKELVTETAPVETKREKVKLCPVALLSLVFAGIAFVFGFVIVTCSFATGWGFATLECSVFLPSFVGLGAGVFSMLKDGCNSQSKKLALVSVCVSAFVLLYTLIGIIVFYA